MRTRYRILDYFKEASDAANEKCSPFYFITPQLVDDGTMYTSNWLTDEILGLSTVLDISSNIGRLCFTNAHKQFLSSILPQKQHINYSPERQHYGEGRGKPHNNAGQVLPKESYDARELGFFIKENTIKGSRYSELWYEFEPPELEFPQEHTISHQVLLELARMSYVIIEVDFTSYSLQGTFDMKPDNMINLDLFTLLSSTSNSNEGRITEVCHKHYDDICVEMEGKGTDYLMFVERSAAPDKPSKFPTYLQSILHFEVYEAGLNKYDFQSIREPLFLFNIEDLFSQVEQLPDILIDPTSLPCSMSINLSDIFNAEHSSEGIPDEFSLKHTSIWHGSFLEMEALTSPAAHPMNTEENSCLNKMINGESFNAIHIMNFEVVEVFDSIYAQIFQVFSKSMEAMEVTIEGLAEQNLNSHSCFDELIVVPELMLIDEKYKSLPIPVLYDEKVDLPAVSVMAKLLHDCKQHSVSASDWLYLDWHQSQGGACNNHTCFSLQKKIEIENCRLIDFTIPSSNETRNILSAIEFYQEHWDHSNQVISSHLFQQNNDELPESVCISDVLVAEPGSVANVVQQGSDLNAQENAQNTLQFSSEKVSSLFNSMSVSSDLMFFMNARRGAAVRSGDSSAKVSSSDGIFLHPSLDRRSNEGNVSPNGDAEKSSIQVHQVEISEPILSLDKSSNEGNASFSGDFRRNSMQVHQVEISKPIFQIIDRLQINYSIILEADHDLKRIVDTFPILNKLCIMKSSQSHLMSLIKKRACHKDSLKYDPVLRGLITMHVLQKTAFHLCVYGIHVAHMCLKKLFQSMGFLKDSIQLSYSLLGDACQKAERGLIEEHPILPFLEGILKSVFSQQSNHKVLLVAERRFCLPLRKKITSMNLTPHEFNWNDKLGNQGHVSVEKLNEFNQAVLSALLHCECLIVLHEHVIASFPFEQFNTIVEYGDSSLSSQFASIFANISHRCAIHLLRIKLEDGRTSSLVQDTLKNQVNPINQEANMCWLTSALQEDGQNQEWIEVVLNGGCLMDEGSVETSSNTRWKIEEDTLESQKFTDVKVSHASLPVRSRSEVLNFPDGRDPPMTRPPCLIIIANIREFPEEMLVSRRSSYQKILDFEKEGLQVIERECHLPVDLILSTAVCLVWYTVRKIKLHASALQESVSSLSTSIEHIADSLLMSLSFSFQDFVLIFEGDNEFLTAVTEASNDLYAAAIGLDIHLQCFLSGSFETTDHIVSNCIRTAMKSNKVAYPAMLESETLAESFLTKFPSINPLSAHAVLSCTDNFSEFLCWTHEQQIHSMGNIDVPTRSLFLFSAQCKFGELGETKSATTDCSSTLTSPFDADGSNSKTQLVLEKLDIATNTLTEDIPENDCLSDDCSVLPCLKRYRTAPLQSSDIQRSQKEQRRYTQSPKSFEQGDNHYGLLDGHHLMGVNWGCTLNEDTDYKNSDSVNGLDHPVLRKFQWDDYGEAIHICNEFQSGNLDSSNYNISSRSFTSSRSDTEIASSVSLELMKAGKTTCTHTINELKNRENNIQCSPFSTEIGRELDPWSSSNDDVVSGLGVGQIRKQTPMEDVMMDACQSKTQCWHDEVSNWKRKSIRNALERSLQVQKQGQNFFDSSANRFHGKGPNLASLQNKLRRPTEFPNQFSIEPPVIHSGNPTCQYPMGVSPCCLYPSQQHKTQSPSIFDNYRYQGGSRSRIACKKKRQNLPMYLKYTASKQTEEKNSPSLLSWTPVDKRAKQTLSFQKQGTDKQSRLVWNDMNAERSKRRRTDRKFGI